MNLKSIASEHLGDHDCELGVQKMSMHNFFTRQQAWVVDVKSRSNERLKQIEKAQQERLVLKVRCLNSVSRRNKCFKEPQTLATRNCQTSPTLLPLIIIYQKEATETVHFLPTCFGGTRCLAFLPWLLYDCVML